VRAHIIWLEHQAGALADLSEALGAEDINIIGIAATTWQDRGAVALTTSDPEATATLLQERFPDHQEVELVAAALEDRPGTLAEAARRLADRDINIHAVVPMGVRDDHRAIGFVVGVPAAARDALGDLELPDAEI
jgi:hypothetical protein